MAARMSGWVQVAALLCCCHSLVSSSYFHLEEGQQKCFIRETRDDVVVIGEYHTRLVEEDEALMCRDSRFSIEAKDPENLVVSLNYSSNGSFRFTSSKPGAHRICLQFSCPQRPLSAGRRMEVHLHIRLGEGSDRYTQLTEQLQLKVQLLKDQVELFLKEVNDHRVKEEEFRRVTQNTDMWIFWWPVVRSLYVVAFIMFVTNTW